jgi:pimeloyl-ACP methyl ester carboxylesterase
MTRASLARVRGVDLAVSDAGAGTPFFWGHGFASSRAAESSGALLDFDTLAARHRVVRWDARGHGASGGTADPAEFRWDNLALDALALATALGVGRFVAGGVSMGAAVALHAAVLDRDRVAGLVLVLPPTAYATRPAEAAEYRAGADLVEREGVEPYTDHVNAQPTPKILQAFAAGFRFSPAVPAAWLPAALRGAAASDLPPAAAVAALDLPALILAWDTDAGHPLSTAERLAELLPDADLHVARRLREVSAWTGLVDGFLAGIPEPR